MLIKHINRGTQKRGNDHIVRIKNENYDWLELTEISEVRQLFLTDCHIKAFSLANTCIEQIHIKHCHIQELTIQNQRKFQTLTTYGVGMRHFCFENNVGFMKVDIAATSFKRGKFLNNIGQAASEINFEFETEPLNLLDIVHNHAEKMTLAVNGSSAGVHLRRNYFKEMAFHNKQSPHTSVFVLSA